MGNRTQAILCLGAIILLAGCASIGGRAASVAEKDIDYSGPYPGPRFAYDLFFDPDEVDDDIKEVSGAVKGPMMVVALIDFPLSLVVDTVFLPFDALAMLGAEEEDEEETASLEPVVGPMPAGNSKRRSTPTGKRRRG
jgi:hypothetical protein